MSHIDSGRMVIDAFVRAFAAQKHLAEAAIKQLPDDKLKIPLDENTNSIAVIVKHMGGNLRSRFTDFLTTDGEKPWRDRDDEFVDTFTSREQMLEHWEAGWAALFTALANLTPDDLLGAVMIRGESHSVPLALARALAHAGYHTGQIVQTARHLAGDQWETITVPRGGSKAHNLKVGYDPRRP